MENYRVLRKVGAGTFGTAYLARRRGTTEHVVIKRVDVGGLTSEERAAARREASLLSHLRHPCVVKHLETFEEEGRSICIVTEYCEGGDLAALIDRRRAAPGGPALLPEADVLRIFVQLCLALFYLHKRKVLHRDIKLANIFLVCSEQALGSEAGLDIRLGDLGVAACLKNTMDHAKTVVGTPYFLSPEICESRPYNHKSDIWAAGCVLYELCAQRHAFEAGSITGLVRKILRGRFDPLPVGYSLELRQLIEACLQMKPGSRPGVGQILLLPLMQPALQAFLSRMEAQRVVVPFLDALRQAQLASGPAAYAPYLPLPYSGGAPPARPATASRLSQSSIVQASSAAVPGPPASRGSSRDSRGSSDSEGARASGYAGGGAGGGPPLSAVYAAAPSAAPQPRYAAPVFGASPIPLYAAPQLPVRSRNEPVRALPGSACPEAPGDGARVRRPIPPPPAAAPAVSAGVAVGGYARVPVTHAQQPNVAAPLPPAGQPYPFPPSMAAQATRPVSQAPIPPPAVPNHAAPVPTDRHSGLPSRGSSRGEEERSRSSAAEPSLASRNYYTPAVRPLVPQAPGSRGSYANPDYNAPPVLPSPPVPVAATPSPPVREPILAPRYSSAGSRGAGAVEGNRAHRVSALPQPHEQPPQPQPKQRRPAVSRGGSQDEPQETAAPQPTQQEVDPPCSVLQPLPESPSGPSLAAGPRFKLSLLSDPAFKPPIVTVLASSGGSTAAGSVAALPTPAAEDCLAPAFNLLRDEPFDCYGRGKEQEEEDEEEDADSGAKPLERTLLQAADSLLPHGLPLPAYKTLRSGAASMVVAAAAVVAGLDSEQQMVARGGGGHSPPPLKKTSPLAGVQALGKTLAVPSSHHTKRQPPLLAGGQSRPHVPEAVASHVAVIAQPTRPSPPAAAQPPPTTAVAATTTPLPPSEDSSGSTAYAVPLPGCGGSALLQAAGPATRTSDPTTTGSFSRPSHIQSPALPTHPAPTTCPTSFAPSPDPPAYRVEALRIYLADIMGEDVFFDVYRLIVDAECDGVDAATPAGEGTPGGGVPTPLRRVGIIRSVLADAKRPELLPLLYQLIKLEDEVFAN